MLVDFIAIVIIIIIITILIPLVVKTPRVKN